MSKDTIHIIASYLDTNEVKNGEAADRMGIPYPTLMRKLNPYDHYQINATEIIRLCLAYDNYSLIKHLNRRLNLLTIKMPAVDGKIDVEAIAGFAKETGEAMASISECMIKKDYTRSDLDRARVEMREAVEMGWKLLRALDNALESK